MANATAKAAVFREPPTMFSGYGQLSPDECAMPPAKVLKTHETSVRQWLATLTPAELNQQVGHAEKHGMFNKFMLSFPTDHKFGSPLTTISDLCHFDVWLKKMAISEALRVQQETPVVPEPPKAPAPTEKVSAAPKKPAQPKGGKGKDAFVPLELSPAEKEAYNQYWSKYKPADPVSPTTTAPSVASPSPPTFSSSPTSEGNTSGVTPDCKKLSNLMDGHAGQLISIKVWFISWYHRYRFHFTRKNGCTNTGFDTACDPTVNYLDIWSLRYINDRYIHQPQACYFEKKHQRHE